MPRMNILNAVEQEVFRPLQLVRRRNYGDKQRNSRETALRLSKRGSKEKIRTTGLTGIAKFLRLVAQFCNGYELFLRYLTSLQAAPPKRDQRHFEVPRYIHRRRAGYLVQICCGLPHVRLSNIQEPPLISPN
jgi:hypothetical protein